MAESGMTVPEMVEILVSIEEKAIEISRDPATGAVNLERARQIGDYIKDRLGIKMPMLNVN